MPILFSQLLKVCDIDPADVRLLRHHNDRGRTPYACWFNDRAAFEHWQSQQKVSREREFASRYWTSFVKTPEGGTLFVGIYSAQKMGLAPRDTPDLLRGGTINPATQYHQYKLTLTDDLADYAGRLFVEWDAGMNWVRRADRGRYPLVEIRAAGEEPPYPGHSAFLKPLAEIETLPSGWKAILQEARGVYVITCPRDKAHYVGMADGAEGFLGRWLAHARHEGDAIGFRTREPSAYSVGIVEVAGSMATSRDIAAMEARWKEKLQSRTIGVNRN